MKKRMKKGSMTIEAALLMPLLLLVVMITLYLFFYVHNKVWLTACGLRSSSLTAVWKRHGQKGKVVIKH